MKSKVVFLIIGFLFLVGNIQAQVAVTLNIATAGTLSTLINSSKKNQITSLTLNGILNGDDIRYIREMAGKDVDGKVTSGTLSVLDLSGTRIVRGGGNYYGSSKINSDYSIPDNMFSGCNKLTSITIPNNTTSIEGYAFYGCTGLTSVTIPNSVTSIKGYAFYGCTGLTSVTLPNSVTSIGAGSFGSCTGLTSVTIPKSITYLGGNAFKNCSGLTQIIVDSSNSQFSSIGGVLFNKNKTLLIIYPGGKSGQYTIPGSVTTIEEFAFDGCTGLTSVTIPNSVTSIGRSAFYGCTDLTSVNIPNSVISIKSWVFYGCAGLTSVTIPNSVTSIEESAFYGCSGLTEIHCQKAIPLLITSNVFTNVNKSTCKLYVPKGSYSSYWASSVWGDFTNIIEEDITPINEISLLKTSVCTMDDAIIVQNAKNGETISIYTILGTMIRTVKASDDFIKIDVPVNQIYIVNISNNTYKVALN